MRSPQACSNVTTFVRRMNKGATSVLTIKSKCCAKNLSPLNSNTYNASNHQRHNFVKYVDKI